MKKKLIFTTNVQDSLINSVHTSIPLHNVERNLWINLVIDLKSYCNTHFKESNNTIVELVSVLPYCKLKSFFISDKHIDINRIPKSFIEFSSIVQVFPTCQREFMIVGPMIPKEKKRFRTQSAKCRANIALTPKRQNMNISEQKSIKLEDCKELNISSKAIHRNLSVQSAKSASKKHCPYSVPHHKNKPNLPRLNNKSKGKPPLAKKHKEPEAMIDSNNTQCNRHSLCLDAEVLEKGEGEQFTSFQVKNVEENNEENIDEVIEELPTRIENFKGEFAGLSSMYD